MNDHDARSAPSFIEIGVPQSGPARTFYQELFGWPCHTMGEGFWAESPTMKIGVHNNDPDCCMVVYFAVTDIEAAVARVRALGGKADEPGAETPGFGRFTECRDTQGVRFGLRQPPAT